MNQARESGEEMTGGNSPSCLHRRTAHGIFWAVVVASASCLSAAAPAFAQTVANDMLDRKGLHAERNYFSPEPWERYDPVSGNVVLTFTDLTLPGNAGRSLQCQRYFNNQAFYDPGAPADSRRLWASRWSFGFPGIVMKVSKSLASPLSNFDFQDSSVQLMLAFTPTLWTADGGRHRTVYRQRPDAGVGQESTRREVVSAQLYRFDTLENVLYMPDGTVCFYDFAGNLTGFRDPFDLHPVLSSGLGQNGFV